MSDHCGACRYDPKKRSGTDACPFNTLYWNFLIEHEAALRANPRLGPAVLGLRHLDEAQRRAVRAEARAFLAAHVPHRGGDQSTMIAPAFGLEAVEARFGISPGVFGEAGLAAEGGQERGDRFETVKGGDLRQEQAGAVAPHDQESVTVQRDGSRVDPAHGSQGADLDREVVAFGAGDGVEARVVGG